MSIFSENLKAGRERAGLSRQDMADALKVSLSAYTNYESANRAPKIEMLPTIARTLSMSIDKLLGYNTPSEERDLFAECKKLIESVTIDGEALKVSRAWHLEESPSEAHILIQRGGELGYPYLSFDSRADFIAFVQRAIHNFTQSELYKNTRQDFIGQALKYKAILEEHEFAAQQITAALEEVKSPKDKKRIARAIVASSVGATCMDYVPEFNSYIRQIAEIKDAASMPSVSEAVNRAPDSLWLFSGWLDEQIDAANAKDEPPADAPQKDNLPPLPESKQAIGQNPKSDFDTDKQQPRTKKRQKKSAPHKDEAPDK